MTSHSPGPALATEAFETAQQQLFETVGLPATSTFHDLGSPPVRTHVFESGERGEDPPMLFVHGTAAFGAFMAPLMARFPESWTIAFDRPGYGLSGPFAYTEANLRGALTDAMEGVLDGLGIERVDLVGHSMGGHASIRFALERPDRVRRLVLVGAVPGFPGTRPPVPFRLLTVPVLNRVVRRLQPSGEEGVLQTVEIFGERAVIEDHPAFLCANVALAADPKSERAGFTEVNALMWIRGWRSPYRIRPDELQRLRQPTLVIWGEHDPLGSPEDVRDGVASIPDARFETVNAAHIPFLAHAGRCADLIREQRSGDSVDGP